jgi:N-methylhydantoinase B/oxoprolinase/acetone carboxylase alpha subunit
MIPLAGCNKITMARGDVFVIQTPGGGGFGPAQIKRAAAA